LKLLRSIPLLIVLFLWVNKMPAQSPAFFHLSTAEGLNDNSVNAAACDHNGMLWLGTTEGLSSFDGNSITAYHKFKHPQISSNIIENIAVDPNNNIWLRFSTNELTMLDRNRQFHLYTVGDSLDKARVTNIFYLKSKGLVAFKGNVHYEMKDKDSVRLRKMAVPGFESLPTTVSLLGRFNSDTLLFWGNNKLVAYDYANMKPLFSIALPGIEGFVVLNSDEVVAYTQKGDRFSCISISQKRIVREYQTLKDRNGNAFSGDLRNAANIGQNKAVFTSRFDGMFMVDFATQTFTNWRHDPLDARSLGGNNTYRVRLEANGYLLVTSLTSGLHYYNTKLKQAAIKPYFNDAKKEVFDGFIQSITSDKQGNMWMGCQDRLVYWNRETDKVKYVQTRLPDGKGISGSETIRAVCFDDADNLWVGTSTKGVLILNKHLNTVKQLTLLSPPNAYTIASPWINAICPNSEGSVWVGTLRGTCRIDAKTFAVDNLSAHPLLSRLNTIPCTSIWIDGRKRVWIGTVRGVWCYDAEKNALTHYDKQRGLVGNTVLAIREDDVGNYYFGTSEGLSVLNRDSTIVNYNRSNGLRNDRCEGILKDDSGFVWVGNLSCILRYDPRRKTFAVFEEGLGFSHAGFRMRCGYKSRSGEMFWGTDRGLTYFFPADMNIGSFDLKPSISALMVGDSQYRFTQTQSLSFPYNTGSFNFVFSSGELSGGKKSQLLYRLKGFDDGWKGSSIVGQASYSKLPAGKYRFEIKSSRDGAKWYQGSYPVFVTVEKPWWATIWFRALLIAAAVALAYLLYRYYQARYQRQEMEKMIDYFGNSGYQHSTVNEILWDICRNCIARMKFEDCVIYLLDSDRQVLVQRAAYGPKNPRDSEILNPIEIPVGTGIVGDVAVTGKACVVGDTSNDSRYVVDDERRYAEITVPILHEGKVMGIIDSEHRKKNYFSSKHLSALQSIAAICSAKISKAIAVEAMKENEKALSELNIKMAESRFLNLRLQMNPHFLFNALSSIQHLIVSEQTTKAYRYLTIFSNFLRSLLTFAEKNFIPLDEEVKILGMYVQLESLRFDDSFSYDITVDDSLNNDVVLVPSLMVQPFAENAIWHGLLHKEGAKQLSIRFSSHSDDVLYCVIEDNGIGRQQSAAIKRNTIGAIGHQSRGIDIITQRLALLQQKTGKPASIVFEDVATGGTRVTINIPYYNPEAL